MDGVVHFEIPASDLDRAKAFYAAAFGWDAQTTPMGGGADYTTVTTTPVDETTMMPTQPGAINGGIVDKAEMASPVITIGVSSIDATLEKVKANGGSVIQPRTAIPDMGAFAYFNDSEGNVMGLWESAGS
jgi:predicted enzyme related to lactoylglutathione lyase